jgi:hypothetical protein
LEIAWNLHGHLLETCDQHMARYEALSILHEDSE